MTTESDAVAWQGLVDHAVAHGASREALDAGRAAEGAEQHGEALPPGQRDALGRFAAQAPAAAESRQVQEIKAMADSLVKYGHRSREQADQMLAADLHSLQVAHDFAADPSWTPADEATLDEYLDGHEASAAAKMPKGAEKAGPLAPSGEANPFEGVTLPEGFGPPAKLEDYRFGMLVAGSLTSPQLEAVAQTCFAAQLPAPIATQIVSEIANCAAQKLDAKGRDLQHQKTMASLDRLWGADRDANVKVAVDFVKQLDKVRPGVLRMLYESGAGNSAAVIQQVFLHAERIAQARRGK